MDKEKLRSCIERLDAFLDWTGGQIEIPVGISQDEYYVDLGAFGEQTMFVELEDEYYPIEISRVLEKGPDSLEELATELRELLDSPEKDELTLDDVLGRMLASGSDDDVRLATVLRAVTHALRGIPTETPLPAVPAPWPGALRAEIDYTAADFPLRYEPPPGFKWVKTNGATTTDPKLAHARPAPKVSDLILDNKGRVSWSKRADDDLVGDRWRIFHENHGDIPSAKGFTSGTPPRAIDRRGMVMREPGISDGHDDEWGNWKSVEDGERVVRLLSDADTHEEATREEFAPPAPVAL